jgi:acyl-CoA thioester hydrolase
MNHKPDESLFSFETSWRTRFTEVDLQGIVHHSETINYFEIARIEYWRQLGIGYRHFRETGHEFVVAHVECDYLKPLRFDRIIKTKVRACRLSRTSVTFEYLIYGEDNQLAMHGTTLLVCVRTGENKPVPLPAEYMDKIINAEKPGSIEIKTGKHGNNQNNS